MAFAGVTSIVGLFALLSLIPFIILYLRRPKPKDETIPSLMFLVQENKRSKQHSFLQRFTSNLLFYLQLLVLLLLSLAVASPFVNLPYDITRENTVVIIDASASMQAGEGGESRFDRALDEARRPSSSPKRRRSPSWRTAAPILPGMSSGSSSRGPPRPILAMPCSSRKTS